MTRIVDTLKKQLKELESKGPHRTKHENIELANIKMKLELLRNHK